MKENSAGEASDYGIELICTTVPWISVTYIDYFHGPAYTHSYFIITIKHVCKCPHVYVYVCLNSDSEELTID